MQIYMMQKNSHFLLGYLSNVKANLFSTLPLLIWVVSTIGTNLFHLILILLCLCWVEKPTKLETQLILEAIFFNLNIILTSYGCFRLTDSNLLEHM
jgi:hypothetical protein